MSLWPLSQRMQNLCSDVGYPLSANREVMDAAVGKELALPFTIEITWSVADLIWKIEELQTRIDELELRKAVGR